MIILKHWSERRTFICSRENEINPYQDAWDTVDDCILEIKDSKQPS